MSDETSVPALTEAQRDFLLRVHDGLKLGLASREADKVRQSLRRAGLVRVVMNPRRWVPTATGVAAVDRIRRQLPSHLPKDQS